jgi:hypothetical protein
MRLAPGRVYNLWIAGATVDGLARMFETTAKKIEAAIKRHARRRAKRGA